LKVDQSILTGEVNPINKDENALVQKEINEIQSKVNMLFSGTLVSNGSAIGVVTAIGKNTINFLENNKLKFSSTNEKIFTKKLKYDFFFQKK